MLNLLTETNYWRGDDYEARGVRFEADAVELCEPGESPDAWAVYRVQGGGTVSHIVDCAAPEDAVRAVTALREEPDIGSFSLLLGTMLPHPIACAYFNRLSSEADTMVANARWAAMLLASGDCDYPSHSIALALATRVRMFVLTNPGDPKGNEALEIIGEAWRQHGDHHRAIMARGLSAPQ